MNEYEVFKSGPRKGQPKTLTDRVVRYLVEAVKMKEVISKTKYRKFASLRPGFFYFVGKNGAVRKGKTISDSISLTDSIHAAMRQWETRLQNLVDDINSKLEASQ